MPIEACYQIYRNGRRVMIGAGGFLAGENVPSGKWRFAEHDSGGFLVFQHEAALTAEEIAEEESELQAH